MSKKTEVVVFSETLSRLSASGLYTFNIVKVLACMFYIRFWLKALLSQSPASQYCKANFITKKLLMHVPCVDSLSLLSLQPKSDERAP